MHRDPDAALGGDGRGLLVAGVRVPEHAHRGVVGQDPLELGRGLVTAVGHADLAGGSEQAGQKLARVLTNDPAMGVIRHTDAGYEQASAVAVQRGVRIPMNQ